MSAHDVAPEEGPQTSLEQVLATAADNPGDSEAADRFVAEFLDATLGVPGTADGDNFRPLVRRYEQGPFAVAFTHPVRWERFAALADDLDAATITTQTIVGRDLMAQLLQANLPLLLNPGNGYGKEFTVPEMSDLLAGVPVGARERTVQQAQQLMVGAPAHVPDGLVERLRAHLERIDGVNDARLAWVRYEDGLQGYLLGVRGTAGREQILTPDFDSVVGDLEGRTMDVMLGGPSDAMPVDSVEPFYERGA